MRRSKKTLLRLALIPALALLLAVFAVTGAQAVEFIEDGRIPAGETIDDDVFITGSEVIVDGTVNGDLFASGATVVINGTVRGSLFAGAQTVIVNGNVEGSFYGGGTSGSLSPLANVGRNVLFGGFSFETEPGSQVGRDLMAAGYQVLLSGAVGRDVNVAANAFELNGQVGGDVKVDVGEPGDATPFMPFMSPPGAPPMVPGGIRIAEEAQIGGDLIYTSPTEQAAAITGEPAGELVYQTPEPGEAGAPVPREQRIEAQIGSCILQRARDWFTLMLLGALALWLLPAIFTAWVRRARLEPLPAAGWGLVTAILGYVLLAIMAIMMLLAVVLLSVFTLGGLANSVAGLGFSSLALVFSLFTLFISYISKLVAAYLLGVLIMKVVAPSSENRWWPLLIGVTLYVLIRAIPVIGWLVAVVATVLGLGAIFLYIRDEQMGPPVQPMVG
ncbi:MAG TPA: polymer-forming cytoskeletal protein [Anaerolineales bacterium]|nr:polymer-forming cytoskeletal protein [Anaerolineales bacterium]